MPTDPSRLLESMHKRSSVCLKLFEELDLDNVASDIRANLARIRQEHPAWEPAIGQDVTLDIDGACEVQLPEGRLGRFELIGPGAVEEPGPWRTVIVMLDETYAGRILGEPTTRKASYETIATSEHQGIGASGTSPYFHDDHAGRIA